MSARLIYVMDPMCSWCWGFAPVLQALAEQAQTCDVPLTLVVGGLRRERAAMDQTGRTRTLSYWQAVHDATGQPFNSTPACPKDWSTTPSRPVARWWRRAAWNRSASGRWRN